MRLVELNRNPTNRQLREFGVICLIALPLVGWYWAGSFNAVVLVLTSLGLAAGVLGAVFPQGLKPVFLALSLVALPIGMVIGEVALALVYLAVFVPIGLAFRLVRRDALCLRREAQTTSYWQSKKQPSDVASYYRQS